MDAGTRPQANPLLRFILRLYFAGRQTAVIPDCWALPLSPELRGHISAFSKGPGNRGVCHATLCEAQTYHIFGTISWEICLGRCFDVQGNVWKHVSLYSSVCPTNPHTHTEHPICRRFTFLFMGTENEPYEFCFLIFHSCSTGYSFLRMMSHTPLPFSPHLGH